MWVLFPSFFRARSASKKDGLAAPYPLHYFLFKGSLVDPRLRASNDIHAPSKLARFSSGIRCHEQSPHKKGKS